jgi:hypothetical protein
MDAPKKEFQLRSWNRFVTRNFKIKPELIGRFHRFPFKNGTVTIRLPKKAQVDRAAKFDEIASRGAYRVVEGVEIPQGYHIHKVDVEVDISAVASLAPAVLTQHCNAYELVEPAMQEKLNLYCVDHETIAAQAFEYWLSVLRWGTDNYAIGRHAVIANNSGSSTYMHEVTSNRKIWVGTTCINFPGSRSITKANWLEAAARLRKGAKAAPYLTILHEAEEYFDRGEYRRALIDMAVATELYVRAVCMSRLPNTLDPYLVQKIDRIGISELTEQVFPGFLNAEESKKFAAIKLDLRAMFESRNQVMHMADYGVANEPLCRKFLLSAKVLRSLCKIKKSTDK